MIENGSSMKKVPKSKKKKKGQHKKEKERTCTNQISIVVYARRFLI